MTAIDRLYCTHCTFGTSALETASADNASKVLGYSVRASSLPDADRGRLRQVFRSIERLLSYDLPRDASAADKEACDASSAPRRLIFLPSLGDCQVVGQVCYRSHDTAGRPGSYFADLLVSRLDSRQPDTVWSPLDCLRLWATDAAGTQVRDWWCESEESLASRVAEGRGKPVAPATLDEPHAAGPAAGGMPADEGILLHDDALLAFLAHDDEDRIIRLDTGGVIPPRWRHIPAAVRRELLARMLQWTLGILDRGRDNVVLAAEPSVAALLFYGVCRLLPRRLTRFTAGKAGSGLGFSTYEPFPERPMTSLVATTFLRGDLANDLPADTYKRSFACNTFRSDFRYGRFTEPQGYVRRVIDLFAGGDDEGRRTVDELLEALDAMPRLTPGLLDDLTRIDEFVTRYVGGTQPLDALEGGPTVKPDSDAEGFRGRRLRRLIEQGDAAGRGAWPNDLLRTSIAWLGGDMAAQWGAGTGVRRVLQGQMPGGADSVAQLDLLLNAARRPPDEIADEAIATVAGTIRKLPECIAAFLAPARCKDPAAALARIIRMIDPSSRSQVLLDSDHAVLGDAILSALGEDPGCIEPAGSMAVVTEQVLCRTLGQLPRDAQLGLLVKHAALAEQVPSPLQSLVPLLEQSFAALDRPPPGSETRAQRKRSIEALQRWARKARLEPVRAALGHWKTLLDGLQSLAEQEDDPAKGRQRRRGAGPSAPIEDVVDSLASLCPSRRDKSQIDVDVHAAPDPLLQQRRDLLATALQVIRPEPSKAAHEAVVNWVLDGLKGTKRSAGTSSTWRHPAVAVMVAALLLAAACGGAAWYGGVLPRLMRRGGPITEPVASAPAGEAAEAAAAVTPPAQPADGSRPSAGPTGTRDVADDEGKVAGNSDTAANAPPPLDLELRIADGTAIVTWKPEAVKGTPHQLVVSGPGLEAEPVLTTVVTGSHQWTLSSTGTFTAEIKPADAKAPKAVRKTHTSELPSPPPVTLKSIGVDDATPAPPPTTGTSSTLTLGVEIDQPRNLSQYGPKDKCFYVVRARSNPSAGGQAADDVVGRVQASGTEFSLALDATAWPIERLRDALFSVVLETPQGTGGPAPAGGTKPDVSGLVRSRWKRCREKYKGILPIRSQAKDGVAELLELPPGTDARSIDLVLFAPSHVHATLFKSVEDGVTVWSCSVGLNAAKKPARNPSEAAPEQPPLASVGRFEIGAAPTGMPRLLRFRPAPVNKADEPKAAAHEENLRLLELCKLCITETDVQSGARGSLLVAQLLAPAAVKLMYGKPGDTEAGEEKTLAFDISEGTFNAKYRNSERRYMIQFDPAVDWLRGERRIRTGLRVAFASQPEGVLRMELECQVDPNEEKSQVWRGPMWVIDKDTLVAFSRVQINAKSDIEMILSPVYWRSADLLRQVGHELTKPGPHPDLIKPIMQDATKAVTQPKYQEELTKQGYRMLSKTPSPIAETLLQCRILLKDNNEDLKPGGLARDLQRHMNVYMKKASPGIEGPRNDDLPTISRYPAVVKEARALREAQIEEQKKKATPEKPAPDMPPQEIAAWEQFEDRAQKALKRIKDIESAFEKKSEFILDTVTWLVAPPDGPPITGYENADLEVIGARRAQTAR